MGLLVGGLLVGCLLVAGFGLALATISMLTAAEPRKIFDFPYQQHDFPNGLRLVTVPTDYPNIVALYVVVNVG